MGYDNVIFPKNSLFLVTGGAGFIGSNLCEAILKLGYRVRCLDDLSTGTMDNVDVFLKNVNYEFIRGDIKNIDVCRKACDGVQYVLHQAAWGSVPRSIEMPLFYSLNNIQGTLNMLEAAREKNVKKFVYASSSSVYGDEENLPKKEGVEGNLLSPYAVSKRCDEEWAKQYTRYYGLDTYGMRYFNVFGRRQNSNGVYAAVIPRFIEQLMNGKQPVINGDGKQSRDFTYIENVIEANLKACMASHEAAGEVYNIAFGDRIELNKVYAIIANALGVTTNPIYGPDRAGDIKHSHADISKARELLNYDPDYSFRQGIEETIVWYKTKVVDNTRKKTTKIDRNYNYYTIIYQWINLKNDGKVLEQYFQDKGFKSIAIYGMGELGCLFVREMYRENGILKYAIDKNAGSINSSIRVVGIDDEFERVDLIVVTLPEYYESIKSDLAERTEIPVISIEDVIFGL